MNSSRSSNSTQNARRTLLSLLLIAILSTVYVANLDGWLIQDDEGTDLYEIWRISEGDRPGVDLVTEQPPVFLLAGVGLGRLSSFDITLLRGGSVILILGSAFLISLLGREIWRWEAGLSATTIYMLNHLVHDQGRLFRPDPWMLAFSVLGLYLFVLAQKRERRLLFALSGAAYGVAMLCKLFAVLPLGGCFLALAYGAVSERRRWWNSLVNAFHMLVPFLLVSLVGMLAFYPPGSAYYSAVLGQHWRLGSQQGLLYRLTKGLVHLAGFLLQNLSFIFAIPVVHHLGTSEKAGERALAWQLPTGIAYLALSRPLYGRYWLYLVPVLSLILGWLIDRALRWIRPRVGPKAPVVTHVVGIVLVTLMVAQSAPVILRQARRQEHDTLRLAAFITAHTERDERVLTDYAGLNFYARRRSIPRASIIAGGRISGGFVTGAGLISQIETEDVQMVLLHVSGGDPPPHHLINLNDFDRFYAYLNEHFRLTGTYDRAGQVFEIYRR